MSSEIDLFPRGATATTKSTTKTDKSRVKSVDRNDLFLTTSSSSSKRKRSTHDTKKVQEDQKKKKKKAIEGEDLQGNLYRRLHKQVRSIWFFFLSKFEFRFFLFRLNRISLMVFCCVVVSRRFLHMNYALVYLIKTSDMFR